MQLYLIIPERVQDPGVSLIALGITLIFFIVLLILNRLFKEQ